MNNLIQLNHISKLYRTETVETQALRGMSLAVAPGEYIALSGPSGCGKSTLLNIIAMLDDVSSGEYQFDGQNVAQLSFKQRSALRNSAIGFVFQSFNLLDELSVIENIKLPLRFARPARPELVAHAQAVLDRVGLTHRRDHRPSQLSGGQQQRVALARALVMKPKLLLLDEPTGNLDASTSAEIMDLLDELNDGKVTIILVTHEAQFAQRASKIFHLADGQIGVA